MVPACCAVGVNKKGVGGAWTWLLKRERGTLICETSEPSRRCTEELKSLPNSWTEPSNGSSEGGHASYQATSNYIRVLR